MNEEEFDPNQTLEDFEKAHKRKMSFALLKHGKLPIRKGLLRNICFLSGLGKYYVGIERTGQGRKGYNRLAEICLNLPPPIGDESFLSFLKEYIHNNLSLYFGDCIINTDNLLYGKISIEYKSNDIKWFLIDYELSKFHQGNFYVRNNFCFLCDIKKETDKSNFLDSQKKEFSFKLKIKKAISFLKINGYEVSTKN